VEIIGDTVFQIPGELESAPASGKGLLRERAYQNLKEMLVTGKLAGEPFLSERKLAKRLGMSNTPVRSAIERLEAEGLIDISPQQGIVVRDVSVQEIADHYEVREALEPFVLRRLAGRLTADQVARLETCLQQQSQCAGRNDMAELIRRDSEFHLLFCEFLGNAEILRTMSQLRDKIHRVVTKIVQHNPDRLTQSCGEHRQIAEAVARGDAEQAASLMLEHLARGRKTLLPASA
jgi:DNA-binding GntR family transcriptional regulator